MSMNFSCTFCFPCLILSPPPAPSAWVAPFSSRSRQDGRRVNLHEPRCPSALSLPSAPAFHAVNYSKPPCSWVTLFASCCKCAAPERQSAA